MTEPDGLEKKLSELKGMIKAQTIALEVYRSDRRDKMANVHLDRFYRDYYLKREWWKNPHFLSKKEFARQRQMLLR